ncbi:MAG: DNA transformation protein [Candidatus Endobugula sp.]|jgi:DNA transformation protein
MMSKELNDLAEHKNLGTASINILNAVGINSYDDLKALGSVETYRRIKQRNIHVSKVMLYALEGALRDVHWNKLSQEHKEQLLADAGDTSTSS